MGAALTDEIRSDTSTSVSGGMRWPMSPSSSVGGPAMLNETTGPNSGSSSVRTTQDTPGVAIRCTTKELADMGASRSVRPSKASRT